MSHTHTHTQSAGPPTNCSSKQEGLWAGFFHQNKTFRGRRTQPGGMDEAQRPVGKVI